MELYNGYDGTVQLWYRGKRPGAECPVPRLKEEGNIGLRVRNSPEARVARHRS